MAAFVAQGCAEIAWLAGRMGAQPATVGGLAGLGDVMLSCYGSLSRNRALGLALGQGRTLQEAARDTGGVLAEGVPTSGVLLKLAQRHRVRLPVLTAIAQILQGGIRPRDAVAAIMQLPQVEHFVPGSGAESPDSPRREEERERAAA
ncbi:hypothetical protein H632_c2161p1 [Helicosporidium sp. ATCC 50920]|nr:hypothetical protein H632_c2161p1 [Helicosporidium sp. ATCC 50920]|eukprot:KDD73454.1 hypothetical protein H632_c2161p1 [Helicosporidium sp. ATCC 50920]